MRARSLFTLLFPFLVIFAVSCLCSSQETSTPVAPETGIITGRVTSANGLGFSDAQVTLTDMPAFTTISDADGYYTLQGVPPGDHIIMATISDGGSGQLSVHVRANETSQQDLTLYPYTPAPGTGMITGQVTYSDGVPYEKGAEVKLTDLPGFTTTSDSAGYYTLPGVPAGDHTIMARISGGGSSELPIHVWANETSEQNLKLFTYHEPPTPGLHPPIGEVTQVFALPETENKASSWILNFGTMNLTQSGNKISGTYHNSFNGFDGTIQGVVSDNTFDGNWSRGDQSGSIHWVLSPDGTTINGNFNGSFQWCGALTGKPFPAGCSFTGEWTSNVAGNQNCWMTLTRVDMTVTGKYCNGSVTGTISYTGNSNETLLNGTWTTTGSGTFQLYLIEYDASQFVGHWNQNNPWCGWRSNAEMPSSCFR